MKYITLYSLMLIMIFSLPALCFSQTEAERALLLREELIAEAKKYVGVPYLWGGTTVEGMDCSGFIYTASRNSVKVQLPRTVEAMYGFMRIVPDSKKEKGDILFFKTVGNSISHAGIYIGNNQFVHSVSDGPNTGVIVSSLNQTTWKNAYAGVGQFLPASGSVSESAGSNASSSGGSGSSSSSVESNSFLENTTFDFSATMLWNFFSSDSFLFNIRGGTIQAHARYSAWETEPGIGVELRFEPRMGIVQVPVQFSVTVPYGFRVYAGPVFTFGTPTLVGSNKEVSASIFPGILGFSWQSPSASLGNVSLSFVQDICWTVFNKTDNSALHIGDAFASGLVFSTGVRFSLDGSSF